MRRPDWRCRSAREDRRPQNPGSSARTLARGGENGMSSFSDRLREIVKPNRADVVERAAPAVRASEGDLETLLDGRWYGHCFVVERRMSSSQKYGRQTIG